MSPIELFWTAKNVSVGNLGLVWVNILIRISLYVVEMLKFWKNLNYFCLVLVLYFFLYSVLPGKPYAEDFIVGGLSEVLRGANDSLF